MKKGKTCLTVGILLAAALGASGCDKMVPSSVIAEQTKGEGQTQASPSAGGRSVPEQVQAPEKYTANTSWDQALMLMEYVDDPLQEKMTIAGIYTGDVTQGEDASRNTVDQHIILTADAGIEVPEAESIYLKKVNAVPLQEETVKKWIEVLSGGELSMETEAAAEENGGAAEGKMTVDQLPYTYSYRQSSQQGAADEYGTEGQWFRVSADWESVRRTADGLENAETGADITGAAETPEDCREEAEALLQAMGLSEFTQTCWVSSEEVTYGWQCTEDTNIPVSRTTLVFERTVDQIPVTGTFSVEYPMYQEGIGENAEESALWGSEYLELTYVEGRLVDFIYTGSVEISNYSDEALFLLPFEEIRQIFENTIGQKMAGAGSSTAEIPENLEDIVSVWKQYPDAVFDNVAINIHKVRLGYMRIRENDTPAAGAEEGVLIPVWDFFGTWTASSMQEDGKTVGEKLEKEEVSLLTIDARDGTVLQRMVGY